MFSCHYLLNKKTFPHTFVRLIHFKDLFCIFFHNFLSFFSFALYLVPHFDLTSSVIAECLYETESWGYVGSIYRCKVQNNLNITSQQNAQISSATEDHKSEKNNSDVTGFWADSKAIQYFPS